VRKNDLQKCELTEYRAHIEVRFVKSCSLESRSRPAVDVGRDSAIASIEFEPRSLKSLRQSVAIFPPFLPFV
jgi:hypothetical protein